MGRNAWTKSYKVAQVKKKLECFESLPLDFWLKESVEFLAHYKSAFTEMGKKKGKQTK